jgi:hypothetical protein
LYGWLQRPFDPSLHLYVLKVPEPGEIVILMRDLSTKVDDCPETLDSDQKGFEKINAEKNRKSFVDC